MSKLDTSAKTLVALAGITSGLQAPATAVSTYGLLDANDDQPACYVRSNIVYNRLGLPILDLATGVGAAVTSQTITGAEGGDASLILAADEADDTADSWTVKSEASGNTLQFINGSTLVAHLVATGTVFAANMNLTCAAGTTALDLSLGTGVFKTSTGVNTIGGTVSLAANKNVACVAGTTAVDWSLGTGVFKTTTGLNTIGGKLALKVIATPVAATGAAGGVAGAAALGSANIVTISSDGATKGVKLLTGVPGDVVRVLNTSATAANLFAASGGTINGGAADAGCAIPASKGVMAICTAADTWTVFDYTAHAGAAA